uniref:Disintegrin domain-containing protein n=1 Tax=Macrostomum lignano TaxID=282301 RepID=A0A1I8FS79_9PLAT
MASHSHRKWIGLSLPSRGQLACLCILIALQPHQVNGAKSPQSVDEYLHSQLSEFELLQPARLVSRRSLGSDALPTQHLHFVAFSRQFHLVLKPDRSYASQLHPVTSRPGSRVTGYADRHRFHLTVYETDFNVLNIETSSTRRRVCRLQLIADHAFVAHVGSVSAALKFLIKATDDANRIFLTRGEVNFTAISFEVSSLVAMTGPTPAAVPASEAMHFNDANIHREVSAYQLLEAFADFRQNGLNLFAHCLNHLVAFRRLKKRLLGLAYQGTQFRSQPGGLCSNPSYSIHGRHTYVARNVGLTTFSNNKGEAISTRQATLVMAHELAHNLGARTTLRLASATPGRSRAAVTGKDINHSRLSVCSRKAIADVLASREADCFSNKTGQVCGNGRREVGEDCDAGPAGDDCCGPDCRLRPGASCSDANSACCIDCRPAAPGFVCRRAQPLWPCRSDAKCDGRSVACPAPETTAPLANGTSCLRGLGACAGGDCLTRCQLVGKTDCSCPLPADACSQCCQGDRDGDACEPHHNGTTAAVRRPDCPEVADFAGGGLTVRMWQLVGRISGESLGDILRCNLVFIVVLLSLLAWVPACCIYEHSTQLSRRARADAVLPVYS